MRSVSLKFNERDEVDTMIVFNDTRLNKEPILQGILDSKQLKSTAKTSASGTLIYID